MIRKGEKLGEGTYAKVYKVKTRNNEEYAFKMCLKENGHDFGCSYREMDIAYRLRHPNLLYMHDVSIGLPFSSNTPLSPICTMNHKGMSLDTIHMTYELAKSSLLDYVNNKGRLTMQEVQSFTCDCLLGLEYLHGLGYIHRDIRADNILIFQESEDVLTAKISDYGFVKKYIKHDLMSPKVNNRNYRPPELFETDVDYSYSMDIWSMGCTVYTMIQKISYIINVDRPDLPNHNFQEICRSLPYKTSNNNSPIEWSDFFPLTEEDIDEIFEYSSVEEFKVLLLGMLEFDKNKRLTATECLNLPFFDYLREQINQTREDNPVVKEVESKYRIVFCKERTDAYKMFRRIITDRNMYTWFSERILFLAMSFVDRALNKISKVKERLEESDNNGSFFTNKQSCIFRLVCLYLSIKYFFGTNSHVVSFGEIFSLNYSEDEMNFASNLEIKLVTSYLEYHIYEKSLYDRLLEDSCHTDTDFSSLFLFVANGHHDNMMFERAYSSWRKRSKKYVMKK